MDWIYHNTPFDPNVADENIVGFVYLVTCLETGKKYIGKKRLFRSLKKRATKTKRARRVQVASNWATYYGSCAELLQDVETMGEENFKREVLHLCGSLGEMSYLEIKEQIDNQVLFREDYYNNYIGCRIHRKHLFKKSLDKEKATR